MRLITVLIQKGQMMARKYKGWSPKQRKAYEKTIARRKKEKAAIIEFEQGKRYGPMKATAAVRTIHDRPMSSVLTIPVEQRAIGSLELMDDDPPHEQPKPSATGYVNTEVYADLLERFHLLQQELAERDVAIARLQLELSEAKRDAVLRANRLGLTYKKD